MSDMERVELAMRKVAQHKCKDVHLSNDDWELLAEAAVKMMWLIENENTKPGVGGSSEYPAENK